MTHITPIDKLKEEADHIQAFLEITPSGEVEELKQRATDLAVYNCRSGKMLADAKYHLADHLKSEVMDIIRFQAKDAYATAKAVNLLCDAVCRDEKYLVDWIERINRATVHQIDLIRTLISYEKEQIRLTPHLT
jgi:hypothetical protein